MAFPVPQFLLFRKPWGWRDYFLVFLSMMYVLQVGFYLLTFFPSVTKYTLYKLFFFFVVVTFMFTYFMFAIILLVDLVFNKEVLVVKKALYLIAGVVLFPFIILGFPFQVRYYLKYTRKRWDPEKKKNRKLTVWVAACWLLACVLIVLAVAAKVVF
jgi:hypothetical protein